LRLSLYRNGVNDFIPKPILHEELLVRINNPITNKRLLDKTHDQRRELYTLATTDKLTGCNNRHSLMEFSGKFFAQAKRHKYPASLLVIALDKFKIINGTHGHAIGDVELIAVGQLLNHSFRDGDLVARFGGEEFVALLSHCDHESAVSKAELVRKEIESLNPNDLSISDSIGVSTMEKGPTSDFDELFHVADEAVYKAKDSGRNRVIALPLPR
jgi:two-component system cell cycle response regulator